MKIRSLAVLPALALACLGLTGCDSKAGSAAVVNGTKISESDLASYLTANAQPVTSTDGNGNSTTTPPKIFVLQYLVRNQIFALLLANAGSPVTQAQLDAGRTAALSGTNDANLTNQITGLGLKPKFEDVVVRDRELLDLIQANGKLTSNAQITAALANVKNAVSINPRYGSWNSMTVAVVNLSKKQLPSVLTLNTTLPGDETVPTG